MKRVVIESKLFEVKRDGQYVLLCEKGWKVVKNMRVGLDTARWFYRALEGCLKAAGKGYYSAHRNGDRAYIVQWCSNSRGAYLALVEYGGGGRRSFIFILEDRYGVGWRNLMVALQDVGGGDDSGLKKRSELTQPSYGEQRSSYREALLGRKEGSRDMKRAELTELLVGGQNREGEDRVVGSYKEIISVLSVMERQMGELTDKVQWLKRCVLGQEFVGLDFNLAGGSTEMGQGQPTGPFGALKGKEKGKVSSGGEGEEGLGDGPQPIGMQTGDGGRGWRRKSQPVVGPSASGPRPSSPMSLQATSPQAIHRFSGGSHDVAGSIFSG